MDGDEFSPEYRAFVRRGLHRLMCSPTHPIEADGCGDKGKSEGRLHFHHDLSPKFGGPDCICFGDIKVNGRSLGLPREDEPEWSGAKPWGQ